MSAYYNDNDAAVSGWLQRLMDAGRLADGTVDDRSIRDVDPGDVAEFSEAHWFAGIGGWPLALRMAGVDIPGVWTGSCPCQPFSAAGQHKGTADERHLWPKWFPLIAERRPPLILGEQVDGGIANGWLDEVYDDLQGIGYAVLAVVLPAALVDAPHLRHRIWFAAYPADLPRPRTDLWGEPLPQGAPLAEQAALVGGLRDTLAAPAIEYAFNWKHVRTPAGRLVPLVRGANAGRTVEDLLRLAGWPTPSASLFNDSQDPAGNEARRQKHKARHGAIPGLTLGAAVKLIGIRGWTTPQAHDAQWRTATATGSRTVPTRATSRCLTGGTRRPGRCAASSGSTGASGTRTS